MRPEKFRPYWSTIWWLYAILNWNFVNPVHPRSQLCGSIALSKFGSLQRVAEPVCVVTRYTYKSVHGKEPTEDVGGVRSVFGWRELDGVVENFPTNDLEKVFYRDSVPANSEVHVNPCYTWCVNSDTYTETQRNR